jgi:hypothetical protein
LTGMCGSIQFHSSSVSSGLAMTRSPKKRSIKSSHCKNYAILLEALR